MNQEFSHTHDEAIQNLLNDYRQSASMFIHELRNPLSLIKGTIQYIEMKHSEVKGFKYWNQLNDLVLDMEHVLSDASLINSITNLNIKETNLLDLINIVVENYMPQADIQHKLLTYKPNKECFSIIASYPCDSDKIKQALSNLLRNALEATAPGDFIEVILGIDSIDSMLTIQINNNGMLIPKDDIDSIFLPFVTHKPGGTGVGLALVRLIINAHMGNIYVTSSEDITSFSIKLPLSASL